MPQGVQIPKGYKKKSIFKLKSPGGFLMITLDRAPCLLPLLTLLSIPKAWLFLVTELSASGPENHNHGPDTKLCSQRLFKAMERIGSFIIVIDIEMKHILFSPQGEFFLFSPQFKDFSWYSDSIIICFSFLFMHACGHKLLCFCPISIKNYWHKPYNEWLWYNWLFSRWVIILIKRNGMHTKNQRLGRNWNRGGKLFSIYNFHKLNLVLVSATL